jgi:hypothetical protein
MSDKKNETSPVSEIFIFLKICLKGNLTICLSRFPKCVKYWIPNWMIEDGFQNLYVPCRTLCLTRHVWLTSNCGTPLAGLKKKRLGSTAVLGHKFDFHLSQHLYLFYFSSNLKDFKNNKVSQRDQVGCLLACGLEGPWFQSQKRMKKI